METEWRAAMKGKLGDLGLAHAKAITGAVRSAVNRHRATVRRQAAAAGLSPRFQKAFRGVVKGSKGQNLTRTGFDAQPQGATYSKAIIKRSGAQPVDLYEVFETGATITHKGGTYIELRTQFAPRKASSDNYPDGTFSVIELKRRRGRRRANAAAVVLVHRATGKVWFVWLKASKVKKRLRARPAYTRIAGNLLADFDRRYAREVQKLGLD